MTKKKKSPQQTAKERLHRITREDSKEEDPVDESLPEPRLGPGTKQPVNVRSSPEWNIPAWQELRDVSISEGLISPESVTASTVAAEQDISVEKIPGSRENGTYGVIPAVAVSLEQWRHIESQIVDLRDAMNTSDWQKATVVGDSLLSRFRSVGDQQTLQMAQKAVAEAADKPDVLPELHHFDEFGACPETQKQARPVLEFLTRRYFRVRCDGLEHIPATEPVILVANHAGVLPYDALLLQHLVIEKSPSRRCIRPLIEDLFYHAPFLGPFLYRMGCVRASRENAQLLLQQGETVVVFPEGYMGLGKHYTHRYRLRRFGRGGFIKLALRTGVPLLPVAIVGAEELHPVLAKSNLLARALGVPFFPITPTFPWLGLLGLLPFPSRWMIRVGPPMYLPHTAEDANNPILVNRLVEEFRQKLQSMVDILLDERASS